LFICGPSSGDVHHGGPSRWYISRLHLIMDKPHSVLPIGLQKGTTVHSNLSSRGVCSCILVIKGVPCGGNQNQMKLDKKHIPWETKWTTPIINYQGAWDNRPQKTTKDNDKFCPFSTKNLRSYWKILFLVYKLDEFC